MRRVFAAAVTDLFASARCAAIFDSNAVWRRSFNLTMIFRRAVTR